LVIAWHCLLFLDLVESNMSSSPRPASSAILQRDGRFLLVLRRNPPSADMYAFPGGRAEEGEMPDETALREFAEETGIMARNPRLFRTYDLLTRAEDGTVSSHFFLSVFLVDADEDQVAVAADDAADIGWFTLEEIRRLPVPPSVLECAELIMSS
jgi:ADP-ribose pyrophosphatase YjhB (NUDIX family)